MRINVRLFKKVWKQNKCMAAGRKPTFTFVPKIVRENQPQDPQRIRAFMTINHYLRGQDRPLSEETARSLRKGMDDFNARLSALADKAIRKRRGDGLTGDEKASEALLIYLSNTTSALRDNVLLSGSARMAMLYARCVRDAAAMLSDDYFERPFSQNRRGFLRIEPFLTSCCRLCNKPSAENNIEGILAAGLAQGERRAAGRTGNPGEGGVIPLADHRGKPFKSEADKKGAMDESGTAGVYRQLREMPGFDSYSADFQEKVALFEKVAKLAWRPAPAAMQEEHRAAMEEFRRTRLSLLRPQVEVYLHIIVDPEQTWDLGTEKSRRHDLYCTYLFITGMIEKFHSAADEKKITGIYALLSSARKWVTETISAPEFFKKRTRDVFVEYADVAEPQFVALSKLTGIPLPPFIDGIDAESRNAFAFYEKVNRSLMGYKDELRL